VDRVEVARVFLGDITFESRIIAQLMQGCQKAAIFAVTIGGLLEMKVRQLAKAGRVLEAAVVDAVGSDAAEQAATVVQNRVREIANAQGLGISLRFSPGYCDWDIGQQTMIFHALNGRSAGIRLNDSCLMVPRKSVSGVIGMSLHANEQETWSPCKSCEQRNCPGRR
jgi:cobalamin-dependent methionine synthase I